MRAFRRRKDNHPYFTLEPVAVGPFNRRPRFKFVPRPEKGIEKSQIDRRWATVVRRLAQRDRYLRFFVKPDSFEMYLAARRIADRIGIPAGWELRPPHWTYRHTFGQERYRLTQKKEKIQKIKKRRAKRKKQRSQSKKKKDDGPEIPPPKVDRDVDGAID